MRWMVVLAVVVAMGVTVRGDGKPRGEIKSIQQIFDDIPADQRPEKGQPWDGIGAQLAEAWIQKNVPGRVFHGKTKYTGSSIQEKDDTKYILAQFDEKGDFGPSKDAGILATFSIKDVQAFRKMKGGDEVEIKGKIKRVVLNASGSTVELEDQASLGK